MSIVQSWQSPSSSSLNSSQSSFPRFHGVHLQITRFGSLIFFRKDSDSNSSKYPSRNSSFVLKSRIDEWHHEPITQYPTVLGLSNYSWKGKWKVAIGSKFLKQPKAILDYRMGGAVSSEFDESLEMNRSGTSFGNSNTKMEKILEKLKGFGYTDEVNEMKKRVPGKKSLEYIFYAEEKKLLNLQGRFLIESPLGEGDDLGCDGDFRDPLGEPLVKEEESKSLVRRQSRTSLAELTLPVSELRRLRNISVRIEESIMIEASGVTQAIVDMIHEKWRTSEVVRLKSDGAHVNMRRMHEILERKTGGLVIWRSATSVSVYRGLNYELPSMQQENKLIQKTNAKSCTVLTDKNSRDPMEYYSIDDMQLVNVKETKELEPLPEIEYEFEVDEILDGLGPRYTDWPGGNPLPVDADLLPDVVSGYRRPFRVLPYGVRSALGNKEATALRRLAKILPPHFAIGRSRQYQGLAMAMAKLWEQSSIAKIALKRGVQLTTIDRMAEDIKKITGGTIVSINKDYMVFFRGKDFLSSHVAEALLERERLAKALQDEEEQARLRAASLVIPIVQVTEASGAAGTLGETLKADAQWGKRIDDNDRNKVLRDAEVATHANLVRKLEQNLAIAECKLLKAERALAKMEAFLKPLEKPRQSGSITDEERFMFRKIGLRMNAFLLLGRRGIFDGTIESMHMHWKYRELVKIVVKAKTLDQVRSIALSLEVESGGILISVDKISEGFAIILFRGKEYKQPSVMRPKNLLTKRKALARSIELQRHEALLKHISALEKTVDSLRSELDQMETVKSEGDEEL